MPCLKPRSASPMNFFILTDLRRFVPGFMMPEACALEEPSNGSQHLLRRDRAEVIHIGHESFARGSVWLPDPQRFVRLNIQEKGGNVKRCGKMDGRGIGSDEHAQFPN